MAELDLPRSSLLTKYRDSMQELQETLVKEKKWRQDAENENRLLRKRNLEIEEQVTDFRYSSVEYIAKLEDLSSENKKLSERNKDFQDHIEKLEEMLDRQQVRSETLEKELSKIEDLANDLKSELNDKQRTLEDWKSALIHYEDQGKVLESENFQLKEELEAYQKGYKELESNLMVKEREIGKLIQDLKLVEMENLRFKEQENWIIENQKLLELKTQQIIDDERKTTHGFKVKLAVVNENFEVLKVEKEKVQEELNRLHCEYENLNESVFALRKGKEDLEKVLAEKISALQETVLDIEKKCEDKERIIMNLHSELKQQTEKHLNAQAEISAMKDLHSEKIKEINTVKSELHLKNEEVFEYCSKSKDMMVKVQNLSDQLEQEKVKNSKSLQKLQNKYEQEKETLKMTFANEIEFEIHKKNQEIHEIHEKFENLLKSKDEELILLNTDREKLQDIVRELDSKLRELLNKYQSEYLNWEHLQQALKDELNSKQALESKYNSSVTRIKDLESQVENYVETVSELKSSLKSNKKQFQSDSEAFLKSASDKIEFWKQKFREEVGYLEKWSESIENDLSLAPVRKRIQGIVTRLEVVLDFNENI